MRFAKSHKRLRIGFLLQPHFSLLSFSAAADALTTANLITQEPRFEFRSLSLGDNSTLSDLGMTIESHFPIKIPASAVIIDNALSELDLLIVCGGLRCELTENTLLTRILLAAARQGIPIGGLWNGIVAVAQANLLMGYSCTLHPDSAAYMHRYFPDIETRTDTFVLDRDRVSAAGPNSAFDLMLVLIQRHVGVDVVNKIREILRADTQSEYAVENALQRDQEHRYPIHLKRALQFMRSNLSEPVGTKELAQHINLSSRAMERLFKKHLDSSPAKTYLAIRLTKAHELLSQGGTSISEVSDSCGFVNSAHFSRAFKRYYDLTPSQLKNAVNSRLNV